MATKTMADLFYETLKDIYFAERQIYKTLPKIAKAAQSGALRDALMAHRTETEGQIERLGEVFDLIGKPARAKTCEAIKGILEEGDEVIEDFAGSEALDEGLVAACQAVEHYEIARYGALKAWADKLGHADAAALLQQSLDEEKSADELLTSIASGLQDNDADAAEADEEDGDTARSDRKKTATKSKRAA
jgi:ferritin-like metal-binding protein YciE